MLIRIDRPGATASDTRAMPILSEGYAMHLDCDSCDPASPRLPSSLELHGVNRNDCIHRARTLGWRIAYHSRERLGEVSVRCPVCVRAPAPLQWATV